MGRNCNLLGVLLKTNKLSSIFMSTSQTTNNKKKIIFCTYSCVYSSIVLNKLLDNDAVKVVAIINSTRILKPNYGALKGSIKQIQLSGWRYATYLFFITDLFSWKQAIFSLRKQSLKSVHAIAKRQGIPILDTKDINDDESFAFVQRQQADYLLAAHFNQLVKPQILNLSGLQCINIHPSLLPAYKGVDPVFYALSNHAKIVGVTLHKMAESFDTGEILLQAEKPLLPTIDTCLFSINCELFAKGAEFATKWIVKETQGKSLLQKSIDKDDPDTQYDSWPEPKKVAQYRYSGKSLICLFDYISTLFSGGKS